MKIGNREYPVDADGVIQMPEQRRVMRYVKDGEVREFAVEYWSGPHGQMRLQVSRVVIRRIPATDFRANARRLRKAA